MKPRTVTRRPSPGPASKAPVARRRGRPLALAGSAAAAVCLAAVQLSAQVPLEQPSRLPPLGRSVAASDDTSALVLNPANLAFLPAAELRWSSIYLDEDALTPWQGHAVGFGVPIPIVRLATGLRLDVVDPPAATGLRNYQWLTWGLAVRTTDTASIGFSLERSYSELEPLDGLFSWSAGLSTRPADGLAISLVARHINAPRSGLVRIDPTYTAALALRPFGSRWVELGLEAQYVDGSFECDAFAGPVASCAYWAPRGVLGIDVPYVGRLRGDFTVAEPADNDRRAWMGSLALAVYANSPSGSVELAGGSIIGNGLGRDARYEAHRNLQTDIAMRGWREPAGLPSQDYAVRVRIEDTPGARGHVALLRTLWKLSEEPDLRAVVFEPRTTPGQTLARVQELRDAIALLRARGKKVLCHLEDASGSALYLCAAANKILMNPAGGLRFAGLSTRHLFFGELLDKLGIRAEFVRIGDFKSAPEAFVRRGSTDPARQMKIDLLEQHERRFVADVGAGRGIPPEVLRQRIANGPFVSSEAKLAGLIDGYAHDDGIQQYVSELVGDDIPVLDDPPAPVAAEHFGRVPSIALIYVEGDMVDGRSNTIPLLGTKLAGSYTIAEAIRQARENPMVGAVVLRVETPGGSSMAAEVIWREVQLTARVKPTIVSMGSYAASGGYYISAPANRIFANPLSITGSIGIFYGKADVGQLLNKIGVNVEVYKTAPRADAESIFRPFTADERKELQKKVGQFYDVFLSRVALGRPLTKTQVDAVGRGRVWTGEQALERRLIDELGGLRQALEHARQQAGLPDHSPILELPPPDTTLLGRLLGIEGLRSDAALRLPPQMLDLVRAMAPFVVYSGDKPLARMEMTPVED